jgi:glutathione synthase/RimK-type ligase-like ATP-grasp enzyme
MKVKLKNNFIIDIINLVEKLNKRAKEHSLNDPLQDMKFYFNITDNVENNNNHEIFLINITASYLSGGGIESSYILNDIVNFYLSDEKIFNIRMLSENGTEEPGELLLEKNNIAEFLSKIEIFYEKIFN